MEILYQLIDDTECMVHKLLQQLHLQNYDICNSEQVLNIKRIITNVLNSKNNYNEEIMIDIVKIIFW